MLTLRSLKQIFTPIGTRWSVEFRSRERISSEETIWAREPHFSTGIEFLGPIFIKFSQWVSTRRDIFPRDVCDTLSRLQRNVTPHPWLYTERLLEETYGPSWRDLFVKFDDEGPIGSGCCAQVCSQRLSLARPVRNNCWSIRCLFNHHFSPRTFVRRRGHAVFDATKWMLLTRLYSAQKSMRRCTKRGSIWVWRRIPGRRVSWKVS